MPTAAISQEPAPHAPTADDLEAALPTANGHREDAPAAPVEIEAEQEDAGRVSDTLGFLDRRRHMSDFPFFALGFAAVVSAQKSVFRIGMERSWS